MDTRVDQWAANAGRVLTVAATLAVLVAAGLLVSPARLQASDECPSATAAETRVAMRQRPIWLRRII